MSSGNRDSRYSGAGRGWLFFGRQRYQPRDSGCCCYGNHDHRNGCAVPACTDNYLGYANINGISARDKRGCDDIIYGYRSRT